MIDERAEETAVEEQDPPGIIIARRDGPERSPVISAFIWGGKVRPTPTLPFGRWSVAAT